MNWELPLPPVPQEMQTFELPVAPPRILQIEEVLGRSEQGQSRPYLCRAEDGALYYVKGEQAGRASLWAEWIAGHLAQALGLPLPPMALVQLDETLWRELPRDWRDVGLTPAFASRKHASSAWFELSQVGQVTAEQQRAVLAFDWWVHNPDRQKGNTNLLWDAGAKQLIVMDHNLAFDPGFDAAAFCEHHVFAAQWQALRDDMVHRALWAERMSLALPWARWACDNAPPEWRWNNPEMDAPANFDPERALALLSRCAMDDELWRTV